MKHVLRALLLSVLLSVVAHAQSNGGVIRDAAGNARGMNVNANNQGSVSVDNILTGVVVDPCQGQTKLYGNISLTASATLITGTAAKKIYICSINIVVAAGTNVAIVEGTGTVCATNIGGFPGLSGSSDHTAATGWNFTANGGIAFGNGSASIAAASTNLYNLCILVSAANQVSGGYSYVVQ